MSPVEYCPFPTFRFLYPLEYFYSGRTDRLLVFCFFFRVVSFNVGVTVSFEVKSFHHGWSGEHVVPLHFG